MYKFLHKGKYGFSDKDGVILYEPQFLNVYKVNEGWACLSSALWMVYNSNELYLISKVKPSYFSEKINNVFTEANSLISYEEREFVEWLFLSDYGNKINSEALGFVEPFHFGLSISYSITDHKKDQFIIDEKGVVRFDINFFKQMIGADFNKYFIERYLYNLISIVTIDDQNQRYEYLFQYTSSFSFKLIKSGRYISDKSIHYKHPRDVQFYQNIVNHK